MDQEVRPQKKGCRRPSDEAQFQRYENPLVVLGPEISPRSPITDPDLQYIDERHMGKVEPIGGIRNESNPFSRLGTDQLKESDEGEDHEPAVCSQKKAGVGQFPPSRLGGFSVDSIKPIDEITHESSKRR